MQKVLYFVLILFVGFTVAVKGQMHLKLSNDISYKQPATFGNHNLESNLKLELPANLNTPNLKDLYKGLFLVGALVDITLPLGDDFKHIAGTGFSGHFFAGYVLTKAFMIALRIGYVRFADKTEEGSGFKYEDSFSQIPILLGAYYLLTHRGYFRPYIGLALGIFISTHSYKWLYNYPDGQFVENGDQTETKFGMVPTLGFYYFLTATTLLHASVEYGFIFQELEASSNLNYLAIMFGVAFALGSN